MSAFPHAFPPDGVVFLVRATSLVMSGVPLDWAGRHRAEIEAGWRRAVADNPRLWNGPMFFVSDASFGDGTVTGLLHRSDFATFLHWRDHRPDNGLWYVAATPMPLTRDGALLAIRMAAHTANAGKVYFPAGAIDAADFRDGQLDPCANMRREFNEETGIDAADGWFDGPLVAVAHRRFLCFARILRLPLTYDEARSAILAHQAASGEDEAEDVVAFRSADLGGHATQSYMRPLLDWHFGTAGEDR